MSTYCKVIATCYSTCRGQRGSSKWPDHNQTVDSFEDHKRMWQFNINTELEWNPGVPVDTIIVVNGPDIPTREFFKQFEGIKTKTGTLTVHYRENIGGSFGAYNSAYKNFIYDWYLFTEDDLIVYGDNYYSKAIERFENFATVERKEMGFLGLIGLSTVSHQPIHCHGGVGLTKRVILNQVIDDTGNLPYYKGGWDKQKIISDGEVPFTNCFARHGFALNQYGENKWTASNLIMPYYELSKS